MPPLNANKQHVCPNEQSYAAEHTMKGSQCASSSFSSRDLPGILSLRSMLGPMLVLHLPLADQGSPWFMHTGQTAQSQRSHCCYVAAAPWD